MEDIFASMTQQDTNMSIVNEEPSPYTEYTQDPNS